jgi:hypothetical protein
MTDRFKQKMTANRFRDRQTDCENPLRTNLSNPFAVPKRLQDAPMRNSALIHRCLPALAVLLGVLWTLGCGLYLGIRAGGDTGDYLARIGVFTSQGLSGLYQPRMLSAHMTTLWMAVLGINGFVVLTACLTALLPWLGLVVLRRCEAPLWSQIAAVAYLSANPELYKWAWYVLTDGLFLIQVMLLVAMVTRPIYPRLWWVLLTLLWYSVLFTRPTGFLLIPGMLLYGLFTPQRAQRWFLTGLVVASMFWLAAWMPTTAVKRSEHGQIVRSTFVAGHILQDPRMSSPIPVPFTEIEATGRSVGQLCAAFPAYCLGYYARKKLAYFFPVFPRYSLRHKIFNAIYFGGLISLTIIGLARLLTTGWRNGFSWPFSQRARTLLLCLVTLATAGSFHVLTHIDSDARFLMVWVPLWVCGAFALYWRMPSATNARHT